jgi:hypothetical protein
MRRIVIAAAVFAAMTLVPTGQTVEPDSLFDSPIYWSPQTWVGSAYTDAEMIAIYRGIFAAYAGTHKVGGNKVIHHVEAS